MRIIEYNPENFDLLHAAASRTSSRNLRNRDFVNHYYASVPWCRLYLLVSGEKTVTGVLGIERMPFRYGSQEITIGFGTNYHSLEPGAGGFLFRHWLKSCDMGISFGGSEDAHNLIRSQKWPYFQGVNIYLLNKDYKAYPHQPAWKRAAKWIARHSTRREIAGYARNIPRQVAGRISVQEEIIYRDDLLPRNSPFELRFAPSAEYLGWRYNTGLSFVRYRLFRVLRSGRTQGYVILNDGLERVIVSQADGEDPESLAWGVVLSVLEISWTDWVPRTVMLTCCNPTMQRIYRAFGFKADSMHPFALGTLRRGLGPAAGSSTSDWLVNYDWGDNGLMDFAPNPH